MVKHKSDDVWAPGMPPSYETEICLQSLVSLNVDKRQQNGDDNGDVKKIQVKKKGKRMLHWSSGTEVLATSPSFSYCLRRFNSFVNDVVVKCFSKRQDSSSNSLVVVTEMLAGSTKSKCFLLPCKRSFLRLPGFCNIVMLLILFGEVLLFKTDVFMFEKL
ncbi:hypothetical protein V6N13_033284 [Hibiscus sabdariffa]